MNISKAHKLTPLLDGDICVYRCGFACKEGEPLENALSTVKAVLTNILAVFPERQEYKLYLTDNASNFRNKLATIKKYKGNRDGAAKPVYYHEIREYMQDVWDAEMIYGQEADDALGIEQWNNKDKSTCIVSIDKDLDMIPGWHYNFVKQKLYYVNITDANLNFWKQMLVGDTTDNIPGIRGIGPKGAEKAMYECGHDTEHIKRRVSELYEKEYGDPWYARMVEVANLLWIRREPDQVCPFV